ncbi:MAG: hypothetical protein K6D96_10660 [Acetatifactor sp.]|nr:hypothetical protein [Acetatifactor sp.]
MSIKVRNRLLTAYSFILVAFSFAMILRFFPHIALPNDEVTLRNIASGIYTGTPDAHLIYIMYPLGLILKWLYTAAPGVEWFSVSLLGFYGFALAIMTVSIGRIKECDSLINSIFAETVCVIFLFALNMNHIQTLQYTVVAGVLVATGIFLIVTEGNKIVLTLCLVLGLWLRAPVFWMAVPFLLLGVIYRIYKKTYPVEVLAVVLILIFSYVVDYFAYSDMEWQQFNDYNDARTAVCDYYGFPEWDYGEEIFSELGYTEETVEVLKSYNFALDDRIGAKELHEIGVLKKEFDQQWHNYYYFRNLLKRALLCVFASGIQPLGILIIVAFGFLFYRSIRGKRLFSVLLGLSIPIYYFAFVLLFLYLNRLPERVLFGFMLITFAFTVGMIMEESCKEKQGILGKRVLRVVAISSAILSVSFGIFSVGDAMRLDKINEEGIAKWQNISDYLSEHEENLYYIDTALMASSLEHVWGAANAEPRNLVRLGIWTMGGPLYEQRLEYTGVQGPVYHGLVESDSFYMQEYYKQTEWLEEYLKNRDIPVDAVLVDTLPASDDGVINIYTFE